MATKAQLLKEIGTLRTDISSLDDELKKAKEGNEEARMIALADVLSWIDDDMESVANSLASFSSSGDTNDGRKCVHIIEAFQQIRDRIRDNLNRG